MKPKIIIILILIALFLVIVVQNTQVVEFQLLSGNSRCPGSSSFLL
jgi:uncharacterized integral membrane protein